MDTKDTLRRLFRTERDTLTPEDRARLSKAACERLSELPEVQNSRCIALYEAFGSELDASPLISALLQRSDDETFDPCFVLPVTLTEHRLAFVPVEPAMLLSRYPSDLPNFLRDPQHQLSRVPDGWRSIPPEAIDTVVVPGLAFDSDHMRLGYGGGYYDAFLAQAHIARQAVDLPDLFACGVCFDCQISADPLPQSAHDIQLDAVVTPTQMW